MKRILIIKYGEEKYRWGIIDTEKNMLELVNEQEFDSPVMAVRNVKQYYAKELFKFKKEYVMLSLKNLVDDFLKHNKFYNP